MFCRPFISLLFLGGFMKQVFAVAFLMALAGSAMAQAGGAAAAGGGTAAATAGTVAVVAIGVAGIAAAASSGSNSTASNH
jgi:acid phosphatase class B